MTKLLFTIGNALQGDDALGPLLAEKLQREPLENWMVIHGGSTPENYLHIIRLRQPEQVLVVDAADMNLPPGSIRLIDDRHLDDPFLITTHNIPLSYTIQILREFVPRVDLLGVQPEVVAFGYPVSPAIQQAVEQIYLALQNDRWDWQTLETRMDATLNVGSSDMDRE